MNKAIISPISLLWCLVSLLGVSLIFVNQTPHLIEWLTFLTATGLLAFLALRERLHLFMALRFFLFCSVGSYAYAVKLIDENFYFSVFEFSTQRLDIARKMFGCTLLGAPFCWYGLVAGSKYAKKYNENKFSLNDVQLNTYLSMIISIIIIGASSFLIIRSAGSIFKSAYGSSDSFPNGALNVTTGIALGVLLYTSLQLKLKRYLIIFITLSAFYLIFCQLLRGLRQDAISTTFTLLIVYTALQGREILFRIKYIYLAAPLFVLFEIIGLFRSGLSRWLHGSISFMDMLNQGRGFGVFSDVIYASTLGAIATTFANSVEAIWSGFKEPIWGAGYLEYVLRLVPGFLVQNRPPDFAFYLSPQFQSGGGVFELAEALLNFGIVGMTIIPFAVSFVVSFLYSNFQQNKSIVNLILFSAVSCVFLRGAWYQTFAYVKALEIGSITAVAFLIYTKILSSFQK